MPNSWGGKRTPGPGKSVGRPRGSKNKNDKAPRPFHSRRSAATVLGISPRMLDCALAAGLLDVRRFNNRMLIPTESLTKFAGSDQIIPGVPSWGGRRVAGPGKTIGRPRGSKNKLQ